MSKKEIIIIGSLALIGLVLATQYDLQISQTLFDQSNWIGHFGEAFGEFPGLMVGTLSSAVLILTRNKQSNRSNIGSILFGGLFFVGLSLVAGSIPFVYLNYPWWYGLFIAPFLIGGSAFLLHKIPPSLYPQLRKIAWIGILTLLTTIVTINVVKLSWSRVRFKDMIDSFSTFTPWFQSNWFTGNTNLTSFPSGHVATASVIMVITLLPYTIPSLKKQAPLLKAVSYGWIIMVMVSRIIIGAHFLSDTIVGALIGLGIFWLIAHAAKIRP